MEWKVDLQKQRSLTDNRTLKKANEYILEEHPHSHRDMEKTHRDGKKPGKTPGWRRTRNIRADIYVGS